MDKTETAAVIAIVYGLLEAVKLLTKALIDKKNGVKPQPAYKNDFLEHVGKFFQEMTESLREMHTDIKEIKHISVVVDPVTNFPRIWNDSPQAKRTHDNVNRLADVTEEIAKTVTETAKNIEGLHA